MPLKKAVTLRIVFIFISIFFILLSIPALGISAKKLELVVLGFVTTVGMSHGSLDWLLAQHYGIRRNCKENLLFISGYSVIVFLMFEIWLRVPTVGLIIFLLMSILHFANDWKDELARPATLVMGIVVVALPAVVFENDVLALFSLLVSTQKAMVLSHVLHAAGYFAIAGAGLITYQQIKRSPSLAAEIVALLVIGILLPPIIYFGIYFCVLHTFKHWLHMKRIGLYEHFSQTIWSVVWPTVLCILIGIWICSVSTAWSFSDALLRTVFIGLAALTVPHYLLLEIYPIIRERKLSDDKV